jgi:hypothetical protein
LIIAIKEGLNRMDVSKIVAEIDAKIASLQQARAVLFDLDESRIASTPRRGRPKGSTNTAKTTAAKNEETHKPAKRKRNLSPEGRKRIADAMKRRWAERRKDLPKIAKKVAVKKEVVAKK